LSDSLFLVLACGLLGALIGSFLNVCISRLPNDESIALPRSHCPRCGAWIAWYDNIPVLSFSLLGGRCRACRLPISWRYPIVEAATALLFAAGAWRWGVSWETVKWCILAAVMVDLVVTDLETFILPDEFTLWGAAAGVMLAPLAPLPPGLLPLVLVGQGATPLASTVNAIVSALLLSGGFWAMGSIYERLRGREGLGFGDVKMVAAMGAFLGLETAMMAVLAASVLGAVLGGLWILFRGKKASEQELPFGSFLGLATLLAGWLA
jgi:leader peptidase (prepilin peptidase)/N-methyltransferase